VPVVGDADRKSVRQISLETKRLINAARDGKLALSELSGGTFTISNLGMHGVEQFTYVINPPEAALLSVGTVLPRVVAFEGAAAVRQVFTITLAIDHRAVDGATGAMFLERLVGLFEDPGHIFTQ
jgi:pyruvate dehydrogenase E2 component (dihydrolipoamide acetyltransferase)